MLFTSMASRPTVTCILVLALPSTRSALLSSSAHATFFVVASGSAVCKGERPPRLRDKGGGESLGRGLTTEKTVSARSLDNRFYKFHDSGRCNKYSYFKGTLQSVILCAIPQRILHTIRLPNTIVHTGGLPRSDARLLACMLAADVCHRYALAGHGCPRARAAQHVAAGMESFTEAAEAELRRPWQPWHSCAA